MHTKVPVRSKDTISNGASAEKLPENDQKCEILDPEDIRRESSGALADSCGSAGAGAKRKGRELFAKPAAQTGQKKTVKAERVKQPKRAKTIEATTEMCVSNALARIVPGLRDQIAPAETTTSRECTQEMEVRSAKLALSVKMYEAHKEFSSEIEKIVLGRGRTGRGGGRSEFREKYLEKILQKLEARMLKDADADL
eukprot:jgi/Undpi1/6898/HiC_scaffold_21.g09374.m1